MLFTYLDMVGEFDHVREDIAEAVAESVEMAEEQDLLPPEVLVDALESSSVLCMSLTAHGMGCGPISATVYVGIDFNPEA